MSEQENAIARNVVDWMRGNQSNTYHLNDYELFEAAKSKYPEYTEKLEEIGNPFSPDPPKTLITTPKTSADADYSPKKFETLTSAFNLADYLASEDEGEDPSAIKSALRLGMPKEYWQEAYNESMAGMLYSAANNEFKYNPEEYETGIMGEVGQFMAGLVNPVDASMFIGLPLGGGAVGGKIALNQLTKWTAKGMANGVRKSIAGTPIARNIYNGILEQGIGFGAYSTAAGAIGSASQQATKQGAYAKGDGTIDAWSLTKDATAAGAEGLLLGAVTGGTGKGIGHKFAGWRAKTDGTYKALSKKVLNVGTQVGVEAAEFTAVPYLLHGMPMSPDGTIDREQVKHDLAHNVALIGTLKTVMNKGNILKAADADMKGFVKSIEGTIKGKLDPGGINAAKERVATNLKEQGGETSIIEESINKANERLHGTKEGVVLAAEKLTRLNELNRKVTDNTATEKERAEFVSLATETMPMMEGFYTEILENEQLRKDLGIEDFNAIKTDIEFRRDQIAEARETYNKVDGLNEAGGVIIKGVGEGKPIPPKPKKNLAEMTDQELILEAMSRNKEKSKQQIMDDFSYERSTTLGKETKFNRNELIKFLEKQTEVDVPFTVDTHEQYISKSAKEAGISGGSEVRKNQINELSKEVDNLSFKGNSTQTSNYNESKGFIENLVRNVYPNRKGGGGGKGKNFAEPKTLSSEIKDLDAFAKYLAKNNKNFFTMTEKDVAGFLGTRGAADNSVNFLLSNIKDINTNVKGIQVGQVISMGGKVSFAEKGARVQSIGEGDFIEFTPSKTGGEVRRIPITPELKGMLKDLAAANKSLGKSFDFVDADGISHDFLFWTNEGKPITDKVFDAFLKVASEDVGRKITKKMFRKSFASWAKGKEGAEAVDQQILNLINKTNLTHKTVADRYFEFSEKQKNEYIRLSKEFINEAFGTEPLTPSKGQGYLTPYEIRQIANKVREVEVFEKNRLQDGGKGKNFESIDGKTFESLLRYFAETSVRSTDILPNADYLKNIGFKKPSSKKPLKINEVEESRNDVILDLVESLPDKVVSKLRSSASPVFALDYVDGKWIITDKAKELLAEKHINRLQKAIDSESKLKKRTGSQKIKGEVEFQGKDIQAERNKFIDEVLKKNNLTREQLKEAGLDVNTLGEFGDGIIKLQRGEWQPADFYHENLHRLKAFAKKTGNKSLSKLIDKAEGLGRTSKEFKEWKKKNPNRDMEEFLADIVGGKASRINFTKGMMPKLKQFVKQLVSKLKTALGVGNFNDYSRVLSKKVQKGFDTRGTKFGKGVKKRTKEINVQERKGQAKLVKERFNILLEKVKGKDSAEVDANKQAFIEQIASMAEVDPRLVKLDNLPKLSGNDLEMLNIVLKSKQVEAARTQKDIVKWLKAHERVEQFRLASNVSQNLQEKILKGFGVKDGNLANSNINQIQAYSNYLKDLGFKEAKYRNWVEDAYKEGFIDENQVQMVEAFSTAAGDAKRLFMPVESVVRSLGFNKLANKLFEHSSVEGKYIGDLVIMEDSIRGVFGGGRKGNKAFEKNKDYFYLMDKERREARIEEDILTKGEKNFISKAFDKEGNFTEAPEGKALTEISNWNKIVKERFLSALKQSMTDAQFEKWYAESNVKWLDSKEYITRSLTDEFKKVFNVSGAAFKAEVKKHAKDIVQEMVKAEGLKVDSMEGRRRAVELTEDSMDIARQYFMDRGNYTQARISSRFLQSRGGKLEEKLHSKTLGKEIDVYDTKYENTVRKYALGMAKYTANVEWFPEYIKIKGHKFKGVKSDIAVLKGEEGGKKVESFLSKTVENQLGVSKGEAGYDSIKRIANDYASLLAKLQLSFPTSGLKNLLVGNYQTLGVVKMRDFARGFTDIFDADIRREVKGTGATETGLKNIDNNISFFGGGLNKTLDFIFKGGLMRPTENINRYIAVRAGIHQQNRLVNILQTGNKNSKAYKNAEIKLKEFYRLTDKDIAMLKKNGMTGADGLKAGVDSANIERRMEQLYQKMNHAAHIYTQGATLDLFMPESFGNGFAKPLTLYKRMAYAATRNTFKNVKIAYDTGSPVRAFMPIIGSYIAGKALIEFYDKILGQTPDKQNADSWDKLIHILWKGEILGILSELFNTGDRNAGDFLTPAIGSHVVMTAKTVNELWTGQANLSQGADTFLKSTIGSYNQGKKVWKNTDFTPGAKTYNSKFRTWRKLYSDFQKEIKPTKGETLIGKDERTPYFKDFLSEFNTGTEEQFARQYALTLIAVANNYYQEGYETTGRRIRSLREAFKEAQKTMDKKMKLLNPNKASLVGKKGISRKRTNQFRQWLLDTGNKEQFKELEALERVYRFKVRNFKANKKKYFKELMIPELMDDFNWD